jgi:peptidoglycan/LPS O-acetylase OafA/YrhL
MTTERAIRAAGTRKYLGLQILRITAATMVVLTHATLFASERLDSHFGVWREGAVGVELFFVLSGFVMVYSSIKLMDDPNGWKIFSERRIVRIVPLYWIATSIKVIALLFTAGYVLHTQFGAARTLESYFFLPAHNTEGGIGPVLNVGWTLNFEMFFYFLFALALLFRTNVYRFVGVVLALLALGSLFRQADWPAASFYLNTIVLDFFFGMVIARICLAGKHLPNYLAIPLMGLGFLGLLGPWSLPASVGHLFNGLAAALIVYSMASLEDVLTRIPRFVLYMADASYAIYLFHPLIAPAAPAVLMKLHLIYPWLSVACSVVLGIGGGCLVHQLIEAPMTEWFRNHLLIGGRKVIHPVTTAS